MGRKPVVRKLPISPRKRERGSDSIIAAAFADLLVL